MVSSAIRTFRGRKLAKRDTTIYVVGSPKGLKKIGLAYNPAARLKAIQTGHGAALSILHARPVRGDLAADIERRAHWLLQEGRVHGEWFRVSVAAARQAVDRAIAEDGQGEKAKPAVGRPALNLEETKVRLNAGQKDRIIALVGEQRMAAFIREAIEEKLAATEAQPPRKPSSARERTKPKPD